MGDKSQKDKQKSQRQKAEKVAGNDRRKLEKEDIGTPETLKPANGTRRT